MCASFFFFFFFFFFLFFNWTAFNTCYPKSVASLLVYILFNLLLTINDNLLVLAKISLATFMLISLERNSKALKFIDGATFSAAVIQH